MSTKNYLGSIALSKLTHVIMEKKGQSGMVKGIFIPLDLNKLEEVETKENGKAIYLPIKLLVNDIQDNKGQNGFIAKYVKNPKKWAEMSDEEKDQSQKDNYILGNIKDFSSGGNSDNSGAVVNEVVTEDDDLPF